MFLLFPNISHFHKAGREVYEVIIKYNVHAIYNASQLYIQIDDSWEKLMLVITDLIALNLNVYIISDHVLLQKTHPLLHYYVCDLTSPLIPQFMAQHAPLLEYHMNTNYLSFFTHVMILLVIIYYVIT